MKTDQTDTLLLRTLTREITQSMVRTQKELSAQAELFRELADLLTKIHQPTTQKDTP